MVGCVLSRHLQVVAVAFEMVGGRGHEGALVGPHGCLSGLLQSDQLLLLRLLPR